MADDIELSARINFETDQGKAAAAQKAVQGIKASADGAAESVNKVKPAADTAKEFGKVQGSAEKSFAAIDSARQVTEGGIMGLGQAVKNLAGQFPALTAALGPVGLALAAFSAWKKVVDTLREAHAQLAAGIRQITLENLESKIRRTAEAYDQERQSIDRVADARQRLSDLEQSKDDAQLRAQLAALELKRAEDKARLNPDDTLGARKIDLAYSDQSSALKEASAARRSERETATLAASLSDLLDQLKLARDAVDTLTADFSALNAQREKLRSQALGGKLSWDTASKEIAAIDKDIASVVGKLKTAAENKASLETPIIEMRGRREVAEIDRRTLDVQARTRRTETAVTAAGIGRDENAQIDALFQDLNAASADGSAVFRNWARQQIEAKERENALTAEFMQQMISLAEANAKQIQDSAARARRLN